MSMPVATYLDRILAAHRAAAAEDSRPLGTLLDEARARPAPRRFAAALRRDAGRDPAAGPDSPAPAGAGGTGGVGDPGRPGGPAVIAEVKRRSPSKGDLAAGLDPTDVARRYAGGGATCLSVLTDGEFFGGSPGDLRAARSAVDLPVLRKDFTVAPADVCDARIMGADAVLLIVAALDDGELADLHALATELGLDALVEVHDEAELERALAAGAELVGVNQRDLVSFRVDTERAVRVAAHIPDTVVRVAESGIRGPGDAATLREAGYDAVLVGESLVTSPDPAAAVAALRRAARPAPPR